MPATVLDMIPKRIGVLACLVLMTACSKRTQPPAPSHAGAPHLQSAGGSWAAESAAAAHASDEALHELTNSLLKSMGEDDWKGAQRFVVKTKPQVASALVKDAKRIRDHFGILSNKTVRDVTAGKDRAEFAMTLRYDRGFMLLGLQWVWLDGRWQLDGYRIHAPGLEREVVSDDWAAGVDAAAKQVVDYAAGGDLLQFKSMFVAESADQANAAEIAGMVSKMYGASPTLTREVIGWSLDNPLLMQAEYDIVGPQGTGIIKMSLQQGSDTWQIVSLTPSMDATEWLESIDLSTAKTVVESIITGATQGDYQAIAHHFPKEQADDFIEVVREVETSVGPCKVTTLNEQGLRMDGESSDTIAIDLSLTYGLACKELEDGYVDVILRQGPNAEGWKVIHWVYGRYAPTPP